MNPMARKLELKVLKGLREVGTALLEEKVGSSESHIRVLDGGEIMSNMAEYCMGIEEVRKAVYKIASQNPDITGLNKNRLIVATVPPTEERKSNEYSWTYYDGERTWVSKYSLKFSARVKNRKKYLQKGAQEI